MKQMTENRKMFWVLSLLMILGVALIPELAMAQTFDGTFLNLTKNGTFAKIITFGLYVVAGWKWFSFFNNFNLGNALVDIATPAILTILAMKWAEILAWAMKSTG